MSLQSGLTAGALKSRRHGSRAHTTRMTEEQANMTLRAAYRQLRVSFAEVSNSR